MYKAIRIRRFRQFSTLSLAALTRVNLIVGRNNAGKSSILESIEMLASGGRLSPLLRSPRRRGEVSTELSEDRMTSRTDLDVRHLFLGHRIEIGASFELAGDTEEGPVEVRCAVVGASPGSQQLDLVADTLEADPQLALQLNGPDHAGISLPVSLAGSVTSDALRRQPPPSAGAIAVMFLGTEGADAVSLQLMWDRLVLTPEEDQVIAAMRLIEPSIERLAFTNREVRGTSVAFVKLAGEDERVPLGSLGDGTRRFLALAISLARAAGGVLLVDEIDTGLHYTTLEKMWQFVVETARRLDVQVFATSHSGDCVRALAWLQSDNPSLASDVSVHRIEKGLDAAVVYSAAEIETAAQHQIEVRG